MELRDWANTLLFGRTLDDKLREPGRWTDAAPGCPVTVPRAPGRPPGLALRRRPARRPLPGPGALAEPRPRAEVLHAFANHELLALELMALVLLRFPDADPAFRRTLVATMRDEQRHLRLYLDRARDLGVEPGEAPVSAFFWDCLADAPDPAAFVAGMSLTLEQANLDFSRHWRTRFAEVGDETTAALLDEVWRDEVRHVRHGVRWLRAWSPPEVDLWTAWTSRLRPPLTARRGRGPVLDTLGRRRAGLDEPFIQRIAAAAHSKGRPPRVFHFTPWFEADLVQPGHTPPARVRALAADLAPTLLFLAGEDDEVVVPRRPDDAFLAGLAAAGVTLPRLVEDPDPGRPVAAHLPWGRSPGVLRALGLPPDPGHVDTAALARKDTAAAVLASLGALDDPRLDTVAGETVHDLHTLQVALTRWPDAVIKAPLGTAGRGHLRPRGPLTEAERGWCRRVLTRQGALVVEPWRQRVLDLSLQAEVDDEGLRVLGMGRFLTDEAGGYRGAVLGRWHRDLPVDLRRFLADDGRDPGWVERVLTQGLRAALERHPGHRGPVGLDALVAVTPDGLRLRPLVEINPRWTFGRVARAVEAALVPPGAQAVWAHLGPADLRRTGCADFAALQTHLQRCDHEVVATTPTPPFSTVWTALFRGPPSVLAACLHTH